MKECKKSIKKKVLWLLFIPIFLIVFYFVLLNSFKLNDNYLYKGVLNSKTVYFTTKVFFDTEKFFLNSNTLESFDKKDFNQIKNKKIVYKSDSEIEHIEGSIFDKFLYFTIHSNKTNSLVRINLNNNEAKELLKEDTSGEYLTVFTINKIVGDFIVMYYNGVTGGFGDVFIFNVNNKNRITIKSKEINSFDVRSGKINIDLENHKIIYPKGKVVEVNCLNNPQEYEMGCDGMFEVNGKFFDVISTKELVKLDLP